MADINQLKSVIGNGDLDGLRQLLGDARYPKKLLDAAVPTAIFQSVAMVELLVENGADIDAVTAGAGPATALVNATLLYRPEVALSRVRRLLELGAHAHAQAEGSWSALNMAALRGRKDVLDALCRRPETDIDYPSFRGWTALMTAARFHQAEIAAYLLRQGANPRCRDRQDYAAFHHGALGGCVAILEQLETAGMSALEAFRTGPDPLLLAVSNFDSVRKHPSLKAAVQRLIAWGIDVNAHDGATLRVAVDSGEVERVRWLLEHGARVDIADSRGGSALLDAAGHGAYDDRYSRPKRSAEDRFAGIVELLLGAGAPLDDCNILIQAAAFRCLDVVERLLDAGSDIGCRSPDGRTALMGCGDDVRIVRLLIRRGSDVHARDDNGLTPLMHAAGRYADVCKSVRALIKAGADPNASDRSGRTVLMHAARTNRTDTVNTLLALGADPKARDLQGKTARDHANETFNTPVAELLEARGL